MVSSVYAKHTVYTAQQHTAQRQKAHISNGIKQRHTADNSPILQPVVGTDNIHLQCNGARVNSTNTVAEYIADVSQCMQVSAIYPFTLDNKQLQLCTLQEHDTCPLAWASDI